MAHTCPDRQGTDYNAQSALFVVAVPPRRVLWCCVDVRCNVPSAQFSAAPVVIVHFARSVSLTPAQQQWVQPTAGSTLALVLDSVPEGMRELADDLVDAAREELREASIPSFTTKVRSHSEGSVTGAFLRTSSLGVGTRWRCVGVRSYSESATGGVLAQSRMSGLGTKVSRRSWVRCQEAGRVACAKKPPTDDRLPPSALRHHTRKQPHP